MAAVVDPTRPFKRRRLTYDSFVPLFHSPESAAAAGAIETSVAICAICLEPIPQQDRAVLRPCGHTAFDFGCITRWLSLSTTGADRASASIDGTPLPGRSSAQRAERDTHAGEPGCPLCKSAVSFVCHDFDGARSRKWYPPSASDRADHATRQKRGAGGRRTASDRRRERERERRRLARSGQLGTSMIHRLSASSRHVFSGAIGSSISHSSNEHDFACANENESDRLARRRLVYALDLRARHVGANALSGFRDFTLADYRADERLRSRASMFLRRELKCIGDLHPQCTAAGHDSADRSDVSASAGKGSDSRSRESARQFIADGVLTRLDIQSEGALRLVGDLLGHHAATLLHELRTFLRSPYDSLEEYDRSPLIQYGVT